MIGRAEEMNPWVKQLHQVGHGRTPLQSQHSKGKMEAKTGEPGECSKITEQLAWCVQRETRDPVSNKVEDENLRLSSDLHMHTHAPRSHTCMHTHAMTYNHRKMGKKNNWKHSIAMNILVQKWNYVWMHTSRLVTHDPIWINVTLLNQRSGGDGKGTCSPTVGILVWGSMCRVAAGWPCLHLDYGRCLEVTAVSWGWLCTSEQRDHCT